ncbi:MAG: hypothetical protein JNK58_08260, partial [Phycisphaerae bacterium]|nr:hypothetical protein [Phycisphaerae bacterium]
MNEPGAAPMIRRPMVCMIALALGATTAVADVTITDLLGEWTTATADHAVRVTFEEPIWPVNQVLTGAWTVGGASFQGFAGTPQPNIYVADFGSPFGTGNWLTANGDENIDITFATPTRALAFDASAN